MPATRSGAGIPCACASARRIPDYRPERLLGESWYLFLRAIGLAPGAGLWRKRFPQALVDALDALFDGAENLACA